jgi:membrane protein implicated in regulation of membrane protease activity
VPETARVEVVMAWWLWVLAGLLLLVAEVATPGGFFLVFFGAGAVLVGGARALGWPGPAWMEWLAFTLVSLGLLAGFRRPLMRRFRLNTGKQVDRLESEPAVVTEDVEPGGVGRAELRGTPWSARTKGPATLVRGQRCRVDRVEGLTLWLRAE